LFAGFSTVVIGGLNFIADMEAADMERTQKKVRINLMNVVVDGMLAKYEIYSHAM